MNAANFNPQGFYLERIGESSNGYKEIHFTSAILRIGRAENMEICMKNGKTISREQSRVIFKHGKMYIENLSKSNYTFLNDDMVIQQSEVKEGDLVGLGTRPSSRHLNPKIPENQKFVYICRKKNEDEVIILSDDEVSVIEVANEVIESRTKEQNADQNKISINMVPEKLLYNQKSRTDSVQQSLSQPNISNNIDSLSSCSSSSKQSTLLDKSKEQSVIISQKKRMEYVQLKDIKLVLHKLSQADILKFMSCEIEESIEKKQRENVPSTSRYSKSSESSVSSSAKKIKLDKENEIFSENKEEIKKSRKDLTFCLSPKLSRTKKENLNASQQIKKRLRDDDSLFDSFNDTQLGISEPLINQQIAKSSSNSFSIDDTIKASSNKPVSKQKFPSLSDTSLSTDKSQNCIKNEEIFINKSKITVEKIQNIQGDQPSKDKNVFSFLDSLKKKEAIVKELSQKETHTSSSSVIKIQKSKNNFIQKNTVHESKSKMFLNKSTYNNKKISELTSLEIKKALPSICSFSRSNNPEIQKSNQAEKEMSEVKTSGTKKRRQSMYASPSPSKTAPMITGEIDMFAKASMMRDHIFKNKTFKRNSVVTNACENSIKKRRMSCADELVSQSLCQTTSATETNKHQINTVEQMKLKSSALKIKFKSSNRRDYLIQGLSLTPRQLSVSQRTSEDMILNKPSTLKEAGEHQKKAAEFHKITPLTSNLTSSQGKTSIDINHMNLLKERWIANKKISEELSTKTIDNKKNSNDIQKMENQTNIKSILKINTFERTSKKVHFVNDNELVSIREFTPDKNYNQNLQFLPQELKKKPTFNKKNEFFKNTNKVETVATISPISSKPTVDKFIANAIDEILKWDARWLINYEISISKEPTRWQCLDIQNHYEYEYKYLQTLRQISKLELLKKLCSAYSIQSNRPYVFLLTKDVKFVGSGRIKLTLEVQNTNNYSSSIFKSGYLILLRARNNFLPVPKDIDYLGYITASNHKQEICVEIITNKNYDQRCVFKAKPLMYLRNEVSSLAAIQPLEQNPILWKIIQPNSNRIPMLLNNNNNIYNNYNTFKTTKSFQNLCPEQELIINALTCENSMSSSKTIMIINGCPGSGKSRIMIETIESLLQSSKGQKKFLICANSNSSIDHIASIFFNKKHIKAVRVGNTNKMSAIAYKMSLDEQKRMKIENKPGLNFRDAEKEIIDNADVVLTTTISSFKLWDFNKSYDLCFIEGANQTTDCELIIPAQLNFKKMVLIGDKNQPLNMMNNQWRQNTNSNLPLFIRMINFFKGIADKPIFNLSAQHRLSRDIFNFCNRQFFNDKMKLSISKSGSLYPIKPYKVFSVNMLDIKNSSFSPKYSSTLTSVIIKLCSQMPTVYQIGILATSQQQREDIALASQLKPQRIHILPFETSQGIEKDVIILVIMEKDVNFANDFLHILMTRAKIATYVFIDLRVVNNNLWKGKLFDFYKMAKHHNNYHVVEPSCDIHSIIKL